MLLPLLLLVLLLLALLLVLPVRAVGVWAVGIRALPLALLGALSPAAPAALRRGVVGGEKHRDGCREDKKRFFHDGVLSDLISAIQ